MVDELFQGWGGTGGTANAVLSSSEYLSQAAKTFNNIEDGFYISPAFLDKITIHIAKNFMDLPKIKVPLILGIWGGKGQVNAAEHLYGWAAQPIQACATFACAINPLQTGASFIPPLQELHCSMQFAAAQPVWCGMCVAPQISTLCS